jgi:hypothetical protein
MWNVKGSQTVVGDPVRDNFTKRFGRCPLGLDHQIIYGYKIAG